MNRQPCVLLLVVPLLLSVSLTCAGCGAKKRAAVAVGREVAAESYSDSDDEDDSPRMVSETTEMSTDQMGSFCSGPLGCTLQGIGWVLALPVRGLVALFDVMF
jgi:hypothetical protein